MYTYTVAETVLGKIGCLFLSGDLVRLVFSRDDLKRYQGMYSVAPLELKQQFEAAMHHYWVKGESVLVFPHVCSGSTFQQDVLTKLHHISYGETSSYSDFAMRYMGGERYTRAVSRALATNPLPLVYPCHRIIGKKGDLVGFVGGVGLKEALLKREADRCTLLKKRMFTNIRMK